MALGAEAQASSWRPIYDTVMKWINFGILAGLLYKYARGPIKGFISQQKSAIAEQLAKAESQLKEQESRLREETQRLEMLEENIQGIKQRIMEMGRKEKDQIIADGQRQAQLIIAKAEAEAQAAVHRAREMLKAEALEKAVEECKKELKKRITIKDHLIILDNFVEDLKSVGQLTA